MKFFRRFSPLPRSVRLAAATACTLASPFLSAYFLGEEDARKNKMISNCSSTQAVDKATVTHQGVTIKLMKRCLEVLQEKNPGYEWTTAEVCEELVKPLSRASNSSLVKHLESQVDDRTLKLQYKDCIGPQADYFVSHSWSYKFAEVVETLEYFIRQNKLDEDKTFFWFDLFINDQNNAKELPYSWWSNTFRSTIGDIGHTLFILLPWKDPVALSRAWVLYEIHSTQQTGANFSVLISPKQHDDFHSTLQKNFSFVVKALCKIDLRRSTAWNSYDKEMIFRAVEATPEGMDGLNNRVSQLMRDWTASAALTFVLQKEEEERTARLALLKEYTNLCSVLESQDRYMEVQEIMTRTHASYKSLLGEGQSETVNAAIILARALQELHRGEESLQLLKSVEQFVDIDVSRDMWKRVQLGIFTALSRSNCLEHGEELYDRGQSLFPTYLREFNALSFETGNLANHIIKYLTKRLDKREEAVEFGMKWYRLCVQELPSVEGTETRDQIEGISKLGYTLESLGLHEEAIIMFSRVHRCRVKQLGEHHPKTLRTLRNIAYCHTNLGDHDAAFVFYQQELHGKEKVLGERHSSTHRAMEGIIRHATVFGDKLAKAGDAEKAAENYKIALAHGRRLLAIYNQITSDFSESSQSSTQATPQFHIAAVMKKRKELKKKLEQTTIKLKAQSPP